MESLTRAEIAECLDLVVDLTISRAKLPRLTEAEFATLTAIGTLAQLFDTRETVGRINELLWRDTAAAREPACLEPLRTTGYLIARRCQGERK